MLHNKAYNIQYIFIWFNFVLYIYLLIFNIFWSLLINDFPNINMDFDKDNMGDMNIVSKGSWDRAILILSENMVNFNFT